MPAGHQQADAFRQRPVVVYVGGQVAAQVVDGVERNLPRGRICLGRSNSHQQRTGKPGTDGGRDDVGLVHARGLQGAAHGRAERLQVRPRRDLGNHAAEPGVLVDAGGDLVGEQRHGAVGVSSAMPTPVSSQELSMARMIVMTDLGASCRRRRRWRGSTACAGRR